MSTFTGEFMTGTTLGSTINLGVPFVPDLILFYSSGVVAAGDQADNGQWAGVGWALGNGDKAAVASHYDNNIAPAGGVSRGGCAAASDCCFMTMLGAANGATGMEIVATGAEREIDWGSLYRSTATAKLPTRALPGKLLRVGLIWYSVDSVFDCVAVTMAE